MEAVAVITVFVVSTLAGWAVSRAALAGIFAAIGRPKAQKQ
ncbi:MAG: hypothetical protein ACREP1_10820 [Rhodanobacteraceae bacterium]